MIVISYDSGLSWGVTSEWVGDKLRVFSTWHEPVTLLTGPRSGLKDSESLSVLRSYSISWIDFRDEIHGSRKLRVPALHFLLSVTLGRVFDFLFRRLAGAHSHGKWSWIPFAFFNALYQVMKQKIKVVYTTGGPSSAHFVGLLLKLAIPKLRLYVELQDPFIGSEMNLNSAARRVLLWLEAKLISHATKVVLVTKSAALRAIDRHRDKLPCNNVVAIYPGAWDFSIVPSNRPFDENLAIKFLHLGTLYSNRNLDLLFAAIDSLRDKVPVPQVEFSNLGQLAVDDPLSYTRRKDFRDLGSLDRLAGLRVASDADFLLLVQHKDSRSEETIPFKTYDYLNLGVPIFALTHNSELDQLILENGGFCANAGSQSEIEGALLAAFKYRAGSSYSREGNRSFSIFEQVDLVFDRGN